MGSLILSPPRDWSAVTLREMRRHIGRRSAEAPDSSACHWFGADFHDAGENFCRACAEKLVDQKFAADPKRFVYLYGDCDTDEERYDAAIDGGWSTEHDSPPYCVTCGETLDGTLTDTGVDDEIDALTDGAGPQTPHDWAMLDVAMINTRGEDITLAEYVAQPAPKDPLSAKTHATNVDIWQRVAPVVIADMTWKGAAK